MTLEEEITLTFKQLTKAKLDNKPYTEIWKLQKKIDELITKKNQANENKPKR